MCNTVQLGVCLTTDWNPHCLGLKLLSWYPIHVLYSRIVWMQALFRRAQLKALVTMHSIEENYGGHLSATEINIIGGALDLTSKTAAHGMTPLDKVCLALHQKICQCHVNKLFSCNMCTGNTAQCASFCGTILWDYRISMIPVC